MLNKFPSELLCEIFASPRLTKSDLLSIILVNRSWFVLAIPILWRDLRPSTEWCYQHIVGLLQLRTRDNPYMEYHRYVRRIYFREQPGHWMVPSPMRITPDVVRTVADYCTRLESLDLWFTWSKRVLVDAGGWRHGDRQNPRHEYFDSAAGLPTQFSPWLTSLTISSFRAIGVNALLVSVLPHCPRLKKLSYWSPEYTKDYDQIDEQTFRTITTLCTNIETLHLRRIDLITEETFRGLSNLVSLRSLAVQWTRRSRIPVAVWEDVLRQCNGIRELSFLGNHGLTVAHMDLVIATKNIVSFACVPLEEEQVSALLDVNLGKHIGPIPYGGGVKRLPEYELRTALVLLG